MLATDHTRLSDSQNFIKNPRLAAELVGLSAIGPGDLVYEIGPGDGALTAPLARICRRLVAVEKDPRLAAVLRRRFTGQDNVSVQTGDFLEIQLPRQPYKVFSNIPFNITSAVVSHLTGAPNKPDEACLVMQKEAAEMYLGLPRESMRSVLLKAWFEPDVLYHFRRDDFTPRPGVDAALVRLSKRDPPLVARADRQAFSDFVAYGFTTWRVSLEGILSGVFTHRQLRRIARDLGLDLSGTPSGLAFEEWMALFDAFKTHARPDGWAAVQGCKVRLNQRNARLEKVHRTRAR